MNRNVGGADRAFRIALGAVVLGVGFYLKSPWGLLGLLPLATGLLRICPAYKLLGISTCHRTSTPK